MERLLITNIQRFSTKDGPGIRTSVFFKGCPLKCMWCHNPETQSPFSELMYSRENCVLCGRCVYSCPNGAVSMAGDTIVTDREKCTMCGECTDVCYYNAREIAGKAYSPSEVFAVIDRDRAFYSESGGGATFSGGECMMYPDFLEEVMRLCKAQKIHAAIDTSGFAPWEAFQKVLPYTDLVLYDIKAFDTKKHEELTGAGNELIWENLFKLSEEDVEIYLRLPLIEGCNADEGEVSAIAEKCAGLKISQVNLLPYHDMGKYKYDKLGRQYGGAQMAAPNEEKLENLKKIFEAHGFAKVKIGG